jgi:hypothetical protein
VPISRIQRAIMTAAAGPLLAGCDAPLDPPTPPLLINVSARGGWWEGGCPPRNAAQARHMPPSQEALSPELTERLAQQFPAGSDAGRMEGALRGQGFRVSAPCASDPAIHLAEFRQRGGGLFVYPIFAQIAWEQSDAGRILWTKGHVAFTGP